MGKDTDDFRKAYEMLENGAEMYARLYGLDEFTVWNHVAGELDKVRLKMYEGYIEKPITYSIVEAVKTNKDGNTVLAMRKGNRTKDVVLDGDPITTADLSDLDESPRPRKETLNNDTN